MINFEDCRLIYCCLIFQRAIFIISMCFKRSPTSTYCSRFYWIYPWLLSVFKHKTSCCSTDSERTHRSCLLPNSVEFTDCVLTPAAALCGSRHIFYILHNVPLIALLRSRPPANTSFLWPTRFRTPNSTSISSAASVGLTVVTNRHTDRQTVTSVTIGRILIFRLRWGLM